MLKQELKGEIYDPFKDKIQIKKTKKDYPKNNHKFHAWLN